MYPLHYSELAKGNTTVMSVQARGRQQPLEQVSFVCQVNKQKKTLLIHCFS